MRLRDLQEGTMNKKKDWKRGRWSMSVKVFTPDGSAMELECHNLKEARGREAWETIRDVLGFGKASKK